MAGLTFGQTASEHTYVDLFVITKQILYICTHTQPFYGSVEFVRDNLVEPVPEETFIH